MKVYYIALAILLSVSANSQIINFPDANFKAKLLEADTSNWIADYQVVDLNGDGEIEVSEALTVTKLRVMYSDISSLSGIENFINLTVLDCSINSITSLDLTNQTMHVLNCSDNQIASLQLGAIGPNTPGIGLGPDFRLFNNQLTSLTINAPDIIFSILDMGNNPLTSVDLHFDKTYYFVCSNTMLTELDLSDTNFIGNEITISDNPVLAYLNIKNGGYDFCPFQVPTQCVNYYANFSNNPALQFVCTDEDELGLFANASTYCSFNPGGDYNTITGVLTYDSNANGCTITDIPATGVTIQMSLGATILGNTLSNSSGSYMSYVASGNQAITPQSENPYFSFTPASFTSSFSGSGETQIANFCLTPNGVHPDLEITILPMGPAQPGFNASYRIILENKGTEVQSGTINLHFNDDVMDFISAAPGIMSQVPYTISWGFLDLGPFSTYNFDVIFNVNSPTDTPAVNIGDFLTFNVAVDSGTDETPADNMMYFNQTVVGSFDPNDKTVLQGDTITWMVFDDYLHYIVRFQNTGTSPATNVVIQDMLSDRLDLSTLEIVSTSHEFRSTLTDGNKFEVFFENINLPAESVDEPGSHGYVAYKIKPAADITQGDVIENTAEIYFDFNFPIYTNMVSTTVTALSLAAFDYQDNLVIYPNPASQIVTVTLKNDIQIKSISVYSLLGQLVKQLDVEGMNIINFDISDLNSGTYMISVQSASGSYIHQLIKL